MKLRDELHINKPMEPGQEIMLAVLLTRDYVGRLSDERLFKPAQITDQQFNVLRILKGGPVQGYLIREIRNRMISHSADVPRLVERMVRAGLVQRREDPADRRGSLVTLTPEGVALEASLAPVHSDLCREVASTLEDWESKALLGLLQQLRDGISARLSGAASTTSS
ncbi:MAG: MarR family winged helix-turn-helix transcriptional regulator [Holophaga sp.]|nr:MarR family winged helix-turn-helix transcriptional regulator [Holophaga sp.]